MQFTCLRAVCTFILAMYMIHDVSCQNSDSCPHQTFKDHQCKCTFASIECTGLAEFPILTQQYQDMRIIDLEQGQFSTLNRSHLEPFPKIVEMFVKDSALSEIASDTFSHLKSLKTLQISGCQLTEFPNITGLSELSIIYFQYNQIREIPHERVRQCRSLSIVDLKGNEISILRNGTFREACYLKKLNVSSNPLHTIESHFFEGMVVEILDLSYTEIDHFPHTGLEHHLKILNLDRCRKLKSFPRARSTYNERYCTDLTFPFLEKVTFEYHALCCQFQSIRYLEVYGRNESRCVNNNNKRSFLFTKRAISSEKQEILSSNFDSKQKRSLTSNYVCLNLTSGHIINDYIPSVSEIFDIDSLCQNISFCFDNRCQQNCNNTNNSFNINNIQSVEVGCVEKETLTPTVLHTTVCWTNGSIIPIPSTSIIVQMTSSPSPSPTLSSSSVSITPTPTTVIDYSECPSGPTEEECLECLFNECQGSGCSKYQGYCDNAKKRKRKDVGESDALNVTCTSISVIVTPISTTICPSSTNMLLSSSNLELFLSTENYSPSPSPTSSSSSASITPTPTTVIDYSECPSGPTEEECLKCLFNECQGSGCSKYQGYCDNAKKRKRRNVGESISLTLSQTQSCLMTTVTPSLKISLTCYDDIPTSTPTYSSSIELPYSSSIALLYSSSSTTQSPPSIITPTPTTVIDYSECPSGPTEEECLGCLFNECQGSGCSKYQGYCDNAKKRKRRDVAESMSLTYSITPSSIQIEPMPTEYPNDKYCSVIVNIIAANSIVVLASSSIPFPSSSSSFIKSSYTPINSKTTIVRGSLVGSSLFVSSTPYCTPNFNTEGKFLAPADLVECGPLNDPFNPCDDVIDSDILRAGIWLVILLSIGGNVLVITVTASYFILRYIRSKKKPHVMYFLYINLAIADLFMGIYLLTIAIVDLETIGDYSIHAIEWQTGPGCRFAGFCAILSSLLSIYTLLIITLERVYTIRFALQRKRFHKHYAAISIIIGWIFIIILCILPMFDISSYSRISICLPFENRDIIDKVYIASLLVLTGIASFIILICYCILFYLVACKRKNLLHRSISGREELKLALRMSLLVVTDFACWAPIALFGLTAALGAPLIGVSEAKILMVFIFPINSCLNPILYSFSTRKFRMFLCTLVNQCGVCKQYTSQRRQSSSGGYVPNRKTSEDIPSIELTNRTRRRSTQLSLLSHFVSLSSLKGGSTSSNQGSRRGSTFSGSSDEGGTIQLQTKHYRPPSPTRGLRREPLSTSSITSDNSTSSNTSESNLILGPLVYPKDRKMSLASLPGLTALPEEREEDTVSVKSTTSKHHDKKTDNSNTKINDDTEDEICDYRELTADVHIDETYMNAFTDEFGDDASLQDEPVIETGFNEQDGTEYQQQKIYF